MRSAPIDHLVLFGLGGSMCIFGISLLLVKARRRQERAAERERAGLGGSPPAHGGGPDSPHDAHKGLGGAGAPDYGDLTSILDVELGVLLVHARALCLGRSPPGPLVGPGSGAAVALLRAQSAKQDARASLLRADEMTLLGGAAAQFHKPLGPSEALPTGSYHAQP